MNWFRNWFYLYIKQTPSEAVFEQMVCKLGEPYRTQHPFPSIRRIVDFTLPSRKVVIEVDGASHLVAYQARKDLVSTIALEKLGWRVIRFTNSEVSTINAPEHLREIIDLRLATRPTLPELEEALRQLPELPVLRAKPRVPRKELAPKKARKRPKLA